MNFGAYGTPEFHVLSIHFIAELGGVTIAILYLVVEKENLDVLADRFACRNLEFPFSLEFSHC